jgi:hypothetical protein
MGRDALGHERLDVRRQLTDGLGASLTSELAEGERDRWSGFGGGLATLRPHPVTGI